MELNRSNGDLGYNGFQVSLNYFTALPDASILPDSNLIVIFKSLLKRDSITKEKSLNDFLKLFEEPTDSLKNDLTILSWIQMYPKLAIDNSRTVRILSHQIQGKFVQLGGKTFAKYLKSSIPLWLLGTLDNDRVVSNATQKSLLESFQNDKSKIEKIWIIFNEQLINFICTAIAYENNDSLSDKRYTKESDLILKYERIINGTILMLIKAIDLIKNGNQHFDPKIEFVLNNDTFWNYMGTSIEPKTLNLSLFKSYLLLLKCVFDSDSTKFLEKIEDINGLYKLVSKSFLKNVKLKSSSNSVIYSNIILQFWDTLIALTNFSNGSIKVKKNFWDYAGSKAFSRVSDYLKFGHCSLNPVYFSLLFHFMRLSHALNTPIDFNDHEVAHAILVKINCSDLRKIPDFNYLEKAIEYMFSTFKLFSLKISSQLTKDLLIILFTTLDEISKRPNNKRRDSVIAKLTEEIADLNCNKFNEDFESEFKSIIATPELELSFEGVKCESSPFAIIDTYFSVFNIGERVQSFILNLIDVIEEDTSISLLSIVFHTVSSFVNHFSGTISDNIYDFIEISPSFIEADFTEPPISLLLSVLENDFVENVKTSNIVNDFFLKLKMCKPERVPEFLLQLLNYINIEDERELFLDVINYIHKISEKADMNETETKLTYKFVTNSKVLENLLKNLSSSESKNLQFIKGSASSINLEILLQKDTSEVMTVAWSNVLDSQVCLFLQRISEQKDYFRKSLFEYITVNSNIKTNFHDLINFLDGDFPINEIMELIKSSIAQLSSIDLSIANPLEGNIGLLPEATSTVLNGRLFTLGKFLTTAFEMKQDVKILLPAAFIGEYIDDSVYLLESISDLEYIQSLRRHIFRLLTNFMETSKIESLIEVFINGGEPNDQVSQLVFHLVELSASDEDYRFYAARVNYLIFCHFFEKLDNSRFEAIPINFNKLISRPLDLAVIVKSASKFLISSSKFDRIRNYVFAEILGVKGEERILTDGLKWITLCTNFLSLDEPYEIISSHRLLMILKHLELFLDSGIAFESKFLNFRVQLTRLCSGLLCCLQSPPNILFDLSIRLVEENLAQSQLAPSYINLRYFTFKLILILKRSDNLTEIHEDLIDLMLNEDVRSHDERIKNQAMQLLLQLNERAYISFDWSKELISSNIDELYSLFSNSEFVSVQRVCAYMIKKTIVLDQQDLVVEYQLGKSTLNEEEKRMKVLVPEILVDNIVGFEYDELELERPEVVTKLLWSWILIFTFFEDVTYSMRSDYINQLKEADVIEKLLDYIFYSVPTTNSKILKNTLYSLESIESYDLKVGITEDSIRGEQDFLLLHLYYLSAKFLASNVQFWFKAIRDKQLKLRIEKFTTLYVSPILIDKILNEVSIAKPDFEKRYDNMTLKINTVSREVKSVYIIDDQTMEMVIKLPQDFPLGNVMVEGPLRLGVKEKQWKAWLMVTQSIISHTDGTIVDAIEVFNRNVNLHFSKFEDCAICYSILHQDLSLPTKVCPTCSNKFHAACLYKWFKSSGSSTCPLCRSAFNFKASRN